MKNSLALLLLGASLGLANSWTGKLVDAECVDRQKMDQQSDKKGTDTAGCAPSRSTTNFAVQTKDGRLLRLDPTGNAKAAEMMHDATTAKSVAVTISGTQEGRTVRVDKIELQP